MCAVVSEERGRVGDTCRIQWVEKECTGCLACAAARPCSAIMRGSNEEGFYRPRFDSSRCTGCGVCEKVCHLTHACKRFAIKESFAAQSFDSEELLESTSGGVFLALASHVIGRGGLVCGVVWDEEMRAVHVLADDMATVLRMSGSKYVQSLIREGVYAGIGSALAAGRQVLFSGLPARLRR